MVACESRPQRTQYLAQMGEPIQAPGNQDWPKLARPGPALHELDPSSQVTLVEQPRVQLAQLVGRWQSSRPYWDDSGIPPETGE